MRRERAEKGKNISHKRTGRNKIFHCPLSQYFWAGKQTEGKLCHISFILLGEYFIFIFLFHFKHMIHYSIHLFSVFVKLFYFCRFCNAVKFAPEKKTIRQISIQTPAIILEYLTAYNRHMETRSCIRSHGNDGRDSGEKKMSTRKRPHRPCNIIVFWNTADFNLIVFHIFVVGCRNGSCQLCIVERLSSAPHAQCQFYIYARATNASGSMRHNGNVILNEIVDSKPQLQIRFAGIREWTLCALRVLLWNSAHGPYGNRVRASVKTVNYISVCGERKERPMEGSKGWRD